MSRSRTRLFLVFRLVADVAWTAGFFVLPWGIVAIGIFLSSAVFRWYLEALALGFLFAVLSGFSAWKAIFMFGAAVVASETFKLRFEPRQWLSYLPIALSAAAVGAISFFLVL